MPYNSAELLGRKETCMVEVWRDGKRDRIIEVIDIWYNFDKESAERYNVWIDNPEVSQVTRSGKGYKLVEKRVEKAVGKEEVVK